MRDNFDRNYLILAFSPKKTSDLFPPGNLFYA